MDGAPLVTIYFFCQTMLPLSSILSLGPTKLIADYDGGCNFLYLGTLCKDIRASWTLRTETRAACVTTSTARLEELVPGQFRTDCFVRGLVYAVDSVKWDQVEWIVARLPPDYALYTDKLTSAVLETGVVSAINYVISGAETKTARSMFRVAAVKAVCKGHSEAAKYLCTRFTDSRLSRSVLVAAAMEGDLHIIKWCIETMHDFPTDATRALAYRGNIEALEWLRSTGTDSLATDQLVLYAALGGSVGAVDWVLSNTSPRYRAEEVCLMVSAKGLLEVLKHLVDKRGFAFNRADCVRFAKKGSGVACWLTTRSV